MENQETTTPTTPNVEQAAAPAAAPDLTITDLANTRSIIELASRRGAFVANELSAVGATFDKLNAFLNAVAPQKTEAES